MVMEDLHYY